MVFFVRRPSYCPIVPFLFLVFLPMAAGPNGFDDAAPDMASLKMLNKLHFNLSKNVMGIEKLKCCRPNSAHPGCTTFCIESYYTEISDFLFLYGLDVVDRPNMDIHFDENDWTCTFLVYPDWAYNLEREAMSAEKTTKRCQICRDGECYTRPFCSYPNRKFNNRQQMVRGSGIYNRPSRTPNCVYDFHKSATEMHEYDLLRYCAKGYFFQGRDYNDPKRLEYRKDWILYLTNGALICGLSDRVETNRMLLANGYKVQLVQRDPRGNHKRCPPWTNVTATASSYEDKREDGHFLLAGIIGSMLVDKKDVKSGADDSLWSENSMQNAGRYRLELHVEHFCTPRGMRAHLVFDVSTGPDQVPDDGIYEDTGVKIYLDQGRMVRTTGQEVGKPRPEPTITCKANGACTGQDKDPPGLDTCCSGCHSCSYWGCCHCSFTNPRTHCPICGRRTDEYRGGDAKECPAG